MRAVCIRVQTQCNTEGSAGGFICFEGGWQRTLQRNRPGSPPCTAATMCHEGRRPACDPQKESAVDCGAGLSFRVMSPGYRGEGNLGFGVDHPASQSGRFPKIRIARIRDNPHPACAIITRSGARASLLQKKADQCTRLTNRRRARHRDSFWETAL